MMSGLARQACIKQRNWLQEQGKTDMTRVAPVGMLND